MSTGSIELIGDLETYSGSTTGFYSIANDSQNLATYKLDKTNLFTSSLYGTASWANNSVSTSFSLDAITTSSNGITVTGSIIELGGDLYKNTIISGTKDGTLSYAYPTASYGGPMSFHLDSTGEYAYFVGFSGSVGPGGIVKVNLTTNQIDSTFNLGRTGISGSVSGYSPHIFYTANTSTGKIYVGGVFTHYNNTGSRCIARLNSDGTRDSSFNVGSGFSGFSNSNYPYTIVYGFFIDDNNKLVVYGSFSSYSGSSVTSMVRINEDGTRDASFTPPGFSAAVVAAEKAAENKIYCAGVYASPSGIIRRLNNDGTLDATFSIGSGLNGFITNNNGGSIAVDSQNRVIAFGNFTAYNGTTANRIVRINSNGSIDTTFNTGGSGFTAGTNFNLYYGYVKIDSQGRIYVTGTATVYNGATRNKIFRLLSNGVLDTEFYTGTGFQVSPSSAGYMTRNPLVHSNYLYVSIESSNDVYSYNGVSGNYAWKINAGDNYLVISGSKVEYDQDLSNSFTSRSLINKEYVDRGIPRISTGSVTASISDSGFLVNSGSAFTGSLVITGSLYANSLFSLITVSSSLNFDDDSQAGLSGVPLGGIYRSGSEIRIRIT